MSLQLHSQKEDYQWIFNFTSVDDCSVARYPEVCGASILDFNFDPPKVIKNQEATLDIFYSNASICDENGQLLFYSNNMSIANGDHNAVPNGDTISYGTGAAWNLRR